MAEDACICRADDGRFAGGAIHGGLGAHADTLEFVDRQVSPVGLGGELDDADVDVGDGGPSTIGTGTKRERTSGDITGGAPDAERSEGDRAIFGFNGELGIDLMHECLASALERDAAQAVRADARDGGFTVLEGDGSFAGPVASRRDDVCGGEEGIERHEVGVVGGDGHRRVVGVFGEQSAFPCQRLRDGNRHAVTRDREAVDGEAAVGALRIRDELPFGTTVLRERLRELTQVRPERFEVDAGLPARAFELSVDVARQTDIG